MQSWWTCPTNCFWAFWRNLTMWMYSMHWWDRIHVSIESFVILVLRRKSIWSIRMATRDRDDWRHWSIDSVRTSCRWLVSKSDRWKFDQHRWNVFCWQLITPIYLNWAFSFQTTKPFDISMVSHRWHYQPMSDMLKDIRSTFARLRPKILSKSHRCSSTLRLNILKERCSLSWDSRIKRDRRAIA